MSIKVTFAVLGFFGGLLAIDYTIYKNTQEELVVMTTKVPERVCNNHNSCKYLVFTKNETFENTDEMWGWKWNSSDIHGMIKPNTKYKIRVCGWRVPVLSMYRNILTIKEVNDD